MARTPRITAKLRAAGLECMRAIGKPLAQITGTALHGRRLTSLYETPQGERVLMRTRRVNKKRNLLGAADGSTFEAQLGIEASRCTHVLVVFGERGGSITYYLVPALEVVAAMRNWMQIWEREHPTPKRERLTREIFFDDRVDEPGHGYAVHFDKYRLSPPSPSIPDPGSKQEIIAAFKQLAAALGIAADFKEEAA